jgi:hypothetical protein
MEAAAGAGEASAAESSEELAQAQEDLAEGTALIDDEPEQAVKLLCSAVRVLERHHGPDAVELAHGLYYYSCALIEVARQSSDALGSTKTTRKQRSAQPAADTAARADGAGPSTSAGAADGA